MRKSLSKIFEDAAKECGVNTCLYARIKEANCLLDYVKEYPVMLRLFQEPIYETNLTNRRRRRTTLYFLDALGKPEPDTQTEAAPIADRMEQMAFSFIDNLRRNGIEVQVESLQGVVEKLDALAAGVEAKLVLTYNVC